LRPWGRDVSGPSTRDGFSDMHFDVRVVPSEQFSKWTQDASNAGRSPGQAFPAITLDVRASASGRVVRSGAAALRQTPAALILAGLDFVTSVVHSA
jgi:hypothetical protein